MKTPILPFILSFALLCSACGNIKSERKPFDQGQFALLTSSGAPLSAQEFAESCANKPGILASNNTICIFTSQVKVLAEGSGSSETLRDVPIGEVSAGTAVTTSGYVYSGSVELVLNGSRVAAVPNQQPVILGGGQLSFRLKPGQFYGVKAFVHSCVNRNQQLVRCPY